MPQATADSSVLAVAIDLPNEAAVAAAATSYFHQDLATEINGHILLSQDMTVGAWDLGAA